MHKNEYKSLIIFNNKDIITPRKHNLYKIRPSTFHINKITTKKCFSHTTRICRTALIKKMDVKGKMNGAGQDHP